MAITARPASFTLNAGATYYPDHLWMFTTTDYNGGAGTTVADQIGTADLTITGADWQTDGTHGPYLQFVAANSDVATYTNGASEPVFGITTGFTVGVLFRQSTSVTTEGIAFIYTSDQGDGKYGFASSSAGNISVQGHDDGGTLVARTGAGYPQLDSGNWVWTMVSFDNASAQAYLGDAATGTTDATATLNASQMDSFGLGAVLDAGPAQFLSGDIAAVAVWANTVYNTTQLSAIYNSGDPWSPIGVIASSNTGRLMMLGTDSGDFSCNVLASKLNGVLI